MPISSRLPGAAARLPMEEAPALDFRRPRAIGAVELNHAYTDLAPDADGLHAAPICAIRQSGWRWRCGRSAG